MTEEKAEKAQELLVELKELKIIDKLLNDRDHKHTVNVGFYQHYGDCKDYERVIVDKRHFPRFLELMRQVISDVEEELEKL